MLKYLCRNRSSELRVHGIAQVSEKYLWEVIVLTLTLRSVVRLEGKLEEKIKDFN